MSGPGALWIRRACEKSRGFDPAEYPNPDDAHAAWNESCICAVIFEEFIRATQEAGEAKCLTFRYPDDGPPIGECFLPRNHDGPHLYPATGEEIDRAKGRAPQEAGEARADADVIDAINEEIAEDKRMADKLPWHKGYRAGLRFAAAAIRAEEEKK